MSTAHKTNMGDSSVIEPTEQDARHAVRILEAYIEPLNKRRRLDRADDEGINYDEGINENKVQEYDKKNMHDLVKNLTVGAFDLLDTNDDDLYTQKDKNGAPVQDKDGYPVWKDGTDRSRTPFRFLRDELGGGHWGEEVAACVRQVGARYDGMQEPKRARR